MKGGLVQYSQALSARAANRRPIPPLVLGKVSGLYVSALSFSSRCSGF
jgi:hypothetical protein